MKTQNIVPKRKVRIFKMYAQMSRHQCDNCRKFIDKWKAVSLTKNTYEPGPNFDKCSSDIKTKQKKIATLCPDCMQELEELYSLGEVKGD